jgi:hypothetical protein
LNFNYCARENHFISIWFICLFSQSLQGKMEEVFCPRHSHLNLVTTPKDEFDFTLSHLKQKQCCTAGLSGKCSPASARQQTSGGIVKAVSTKN